MLTGTLVFDHPTLPAAAKHLHSLLAPVQSSPRILAAAASTASTSAQGKHLLAVSMAAHVPCHASPGDSVARVPAQRWDTDSPVSRTQTIAARYGAWLAGVELFDPDAFGITISEAEFMDPQQRLLLHASLEVLQVLIALSKHCAYIFVQYL